MIATFKHICKWSNKLQSLPCGIFSNLKLKKTVLLSACKFSNDISPSIRVVPLTHRFIIKLSGKDAVEFLQGLVTNDVTQLPDKKCMYAMVLNNKGRVMHDVIMYWQEKEENTLLLECQLDSADILMRTFQRYKLRKKVDITSQDSLRVWQVQLHRSLLYPSTIQLDSLHEMLSPPMFQNTVDPLNKENVVALSPDPRLSWLGWRVLSLGQPCSDEMIGEEEMYHNFRYFYGIPEGPSDLIPEKSLPLESNIDFMNGISFDKGCYLGQELTARSHFTGMIRKRLIPVIISITRNKLKSGSSIFDQKGKRVGKFLSTVNDRHGLALVQLDRQNVLLVTANGVQIYANKTLWWPNPI